MDFSTWVFEHISTISNIVSIAAGVIGFAVYLRAELIGLKSDVIQIKEHQKLLMESFRQINNVLTQIAVQDARLNMVEKDIDELRHGKGYVS